MAHKNKKGLKNLHHTNIFFNVLIINSCAGSLKYSSWFSLSLYFLITLIDNITFLHCFRLYLSNWYSCKISTTKTCEKSSILFLGITLMSWFYFDHHNDSKYAVPDIYHKNINSAKILLLKSSIYSSILLLYFLLYIYIIILITM